LQDQQLVAAVEAQHDDLKQATCGVEAETELSSRAEVIQVTYEDRVLGGRDSIVGTYAAAPRCGPSPDVSADRFPDCR